MAQVLLNQISKEVSDITNPKVTALNEPVTTVSKGTSSILRRLRYKTGKLNTNISCFSEENKQASDNNVNKTLVLNVDELENSSSCDDPGIRQSKALLQAERKPPNPTCKKSVKKKQKGFPCEVCSYIASSSHRLKEHLSRHSGKKHLGCDICGKTFAWRYSLKSHMTSHLENNPNSCPVCGKKYCNNSSVKNHVLRVHGNPKKDFKCDKCEKSFVTKAELKRHSFNHTKDKPFVCEFCGNSYRFKGALSVHYRVHSGEKPYKCEFCEKEFLHLSSIIGHRRRHTGEKPFQCKECGKKFRIKQALTAHMSVHSENEGKYRCYECDKTFKSRSGYHVHMDFHMGIKKYSCKYCGRAFRVLCNMRKHMRRHLGEKPHVCELCGKTFIEKQELKNHMKSHTDNSQKQKKNSVAPIISSTEIIPPPTLTNTTCHIETSVFANTQHTDMIPHIDMTDNQVIYDCNMTNSIDKCSADKCQLLQDNYVSQFLYPQQPSVQYVPQSVPIQNIYSTDPDQNVQRSACLSNMNSASFNCVQLNNQSFNSFSYNLPSSDELLSKCKLCRSLFHSTLILRSHMLDYHRIDEENVDELLN